VNATAAISIVLLTVQHKHVLSQYVEQVSGTKKVTGDASGMQPANSNIEHDKIKK
jgi:hypothetical protein